jgi:leucyl-tRNA synthetase
LSPAARDLRREVHLLLKQACFDYERLQYNTVVSAVMKMLNALESAAHEAKAVYRELMSILLRVLYPLAPHITHVLWQELAYARQSGPLFDAPWPRPADSALQQDEITWVIQVNGKLRGNMRLALDAKREMIENAAVSEPHVAKFVAGQAIKKIVVVPGKLVNIVV